MRKNSIIKINFMLGLAWLGPPKICVKSGGAETKILDRAAGPRKQPR